MLDDLLKETKSFRYQITVKVELRKYKPNETDFSSAYLNSATKLWINSKFDLDKSFQEALCTKLTTGLMKDLVGLLN